MSGPLTHEDIFLGWETTQRLSGICELRGWGSDAGERVDLGPEVKDLALRYGRPGVIRGWEFSVAYQEVRQFDFGTWPEHMPRADRLKMKRIIHSPQWVMISASGLKIAQPVTGKWIRRGHKDFDRLSKLPVVGTVNEGK